MNKNPLKQYLIDKREELFIQEKTTYPRTELTQNILKHLNPEIITVLTGPRRAGKSYLLKLIAHQLTQKDIAKEQLFYLNFEDPDLFNFPLNHYRLLLACLEELAPTATPPYQHYLFLDEIQALPHADVILQALHALGTYTIIVTGSNAKLLSREISTLLTGRNRSIFIPTLHYRELLELVLPNYNAKQLLTEATTTQQALCNKTFDEYLLHSSFPTAKKLGNDSLIKQYFTDVITKDIFYRYRIHTKKQGIMQLYLYILSNIKNQHSLRSLNEATPSISSKTSTGKFVDYLEETYLIFSLRNHHYSMKKRYRDKTKYYTHDNGLITQIGHYPTDRTATLFENIIARELFIHYPENVFFLRNHQGRYDIDFFIPKSETRSEGLLVNASLGWQQKKTRERELNSLQHAMKATNCTHSYLVTPDLSETITRENRTITILPAWQFFLMLQ